jgi:AcrR family transcriptional regulator
MEISTRGLHPSKPAADAASTQVPHMVAKTPAKKTTLRQQRHFQEASSGDSKKSRTRALLLDTAITVFAARGIETASILEITSSAGLANGSFYYHFPDKAALVEEVGRSVAATLVRETDMAMISIEAGNERVAFGTLFFIRRGVANPSWGRLVVRALAEMGEFQEQISSGIRKDVQIGLDQGLFEVQSFPGLAAMLLGIVSAGMHEILERPAQAGVDVMAADAILRVLGIRPRMAQALTTQALARLDAMS